MCAITMRVPGSGPYLCRDEITGRYVMSSPAMLETVLAELNYVLVQSGELALNDFYERVELPPVLIGNDMGWSGDTFLSLYFTAEIANDGHPVIVFSFHRVPKVTNGPFASR